MRQFAICKQEKSIIFKEMLVLGLMTSKDLDKKVPELLMILLKHIGKESLFVESNEYQLTLSTYKKVILSLLGFTKKNQLDWSLLLDDVSSEEKTLSSEELVISFYYVLLTKGVDGLTPLETAVLNHKIILPTGCSYFLVNGKAQPIFEEFISERVFVETDLDTDGDGKKDRIAVYIKRPKVMNNQKVPAIYTANPYGFGCLEECYDTPHDVDCDLNTEFFENELSDTCHELSSELLEEFTAKDDVDCTFEFPDIETMGELPDYFLPRGFAKVVAGGIGTKDSDGFRTCGSFEETLSTIAVIEWLSGKRAAFSTREGVERVHALWCSGKVAMTGKSYLGTLAIAAATTGVKGLKTIIPEAAISNWYDYYRENGVLSSALGWQGDDTDILAEYCFSRSFEPNFDESINRKFQEELNKMRVKQDRKTGLYNDFWHDRNYLKDVSKIKASVFAIHGLNDWNVKPKQVGEFWREIQNLNSDSKLLLHQGEHVYINQLASIDFYDILNLWLTQELLGIENGATENLPKVLVQSNICQDDWQVRDDWNQDQSKQTTLLSQTIYDRKQQNESGYLTFIDNKSTSGYCKQKNNTDDWQKHFVTGENRNDQIRFDLLTAVQSINLSGTISVQLKMALDKPTGIISAMLVDYGEDYRYLPELANCEAHFVYHDNLVDKKSSQCFKRETNPSSYKVITRGHLNASVTQGNTRNEPLAIGEFHTFNLVLHPCDYWIKPNHTLGLIIYGMDMETTQRPNEVTTYKLDVGGSFVVW